MFLTIFVIILTLIFGYFFTQASGYGIHKLLHWSRLGKLYRSHKTHHEKLYPPEDFLSKTYRDAPISDRPLYYYLLAIALSSVVFYFLLPTAIAVTLLTEMLILAYANDWVHTATHIEGHWLERFEWFVKWRELHLIHHENDAVNIGIFSWFTDKLFGTYLERAEKA